MYKSIHKETDAEIIILAPSWVTEIDLLRDWSQQDVLLCQGCRQPVRVKAGGIKTWHFAHKHRQDCPINSESAELLQARAILYHWLVQKFGVERVTLEKKVEGLPRPADCWVGGKQQFAYWLLDTEMRSRRREGVLTTFSQQNIPVNWIFLATMLEEREKQEVSLTPTQRTFMHSTKYKPVWGTDKTIHYLDHETSQVITYRGLRLTHLPQIYFGQKLSHPLEVMLVSPQTGELVHPGEYERLKAYEEEQRKKEEVLYLTRGYEHLKAYEKEQKKTEEAPLPIFRSALPLVEQPGHSNPTSYASQPENIVSQIGICMDCGEQTADWWFYNNKTGQCRCRKCQQKRLTKD